MENTPKHPFDYHKPSEGQIKNIARIREVCKSFSALILSMPMTLREQDEAMKRLEEVSMWANKAIVLYDEGPVDDGMDDRVIAGMVRILINGEAFLVPRSQKEIGYSAFFEAPIVSYHSGVRGADVEYKLAGQPDWHRLAVGCFCGLDDEMEFKVTDPFADSVVR